MNLLIESVVLFFLLSYPGSLLNQHRWLSEEWAAAEKKAEKIGGIAVSYTPIKIFLPNGETYDFDICVKHGELRLLKTTK